MGLHTAATKAVDNPVDKSSELWETFPVSTCSAGRSHPYGMMVDNRRSTKRRVSCTNGRLSTIHSTYYCSNQISLLLRKEATP